jgi:hypothetical protein
MQIHIIYLPLVFFLGMTYEHWRRRRLIEKQLATMVDMLRNRVENRDAVTRTGDQDPT